MTQNKITEDMLLHGTGISKVDENGTVTHIPIEEIYMKQNVTEQDLRVAEAVTKVVVEHLYHESPQHMYRNIANIIATHVAERVESETKELREALEKSRMALEEWVISSEREAIIKENAFNDIDTALQNHRKSRGE